MKTLYLTDSSANIAVDKDNDVVSCMRSEDRYDIRNIYYMDEPMHIVFDNGTVKEELDAKKGDILLLFYSNSYNKYHIDTIRSKQWAANIKNRRDIEQREKEAWAARNAEPEAPSCDCAECCKKCDYCTNTAEPKMETVAKKIKNVLKKVKKG